MHVGLLALALATPPSSSLSSSSRGSGAICGYSMPRVVLAGVISNPSPNPSWIACRMRSKAKWCRQERAQLRANVTEYEADRNAGKHLFRCPLLALILESYFPLNPHRRLVP